LRNSRLEKNDVREEKDDIYFNHWLIPPLLLRRRLQGWLTG
jgi:hypothetical protein